MRLDMNLDAIYAVAMQAKLIPIDRLDNTIIYKTDNHIVANYFRNQGTTAVASTPQEFEDACTNEEVETVFVPKNTFGLGIIRMIEQRVSTDKMIVMENSNAHE